MKNHKPYFIRATYEWITDNNQKPHIVIDTRNLSFQLSDQLLSDDFLVLNISPDSVRDLAFTKERIRFITKFSGISKKLDLPIESVKAIYSIENYAGVFFS